MIKQVKQQNKLKIDTQNNMKTIWERKKKSTFQHVRWKLAGNMNVIKFKFCRDFDAYMYLTLNAINSTRWKLNNNFEIILILKWSILKGSLSCKCMLPSVNVLLCIHHMYLITFGCKYLLYIL